MRIPSAGLIASLGLQSSSLHISKGRRFLYSTVARTVVGSGEAYEVPVVMLECIAFP